MTREEHKLRAKLMGMVYVGVFGYYAEGIDPHRNRLDAMSLEPLSIDQVRERQSKARLPLAKGGDWYND